MRISQLMTSTPVTCRSTSTLYEAARLMSERDVGSLPVVDDAGRLLGMLTDRDVCLSVYEHDQPLHGIAVAEAMSLRTLCCAPGDSVEEAARTMARHGLRRLPVVDLSGQVVGIVSIDDLAGATTRRDSGVTDAIVARTLAAIAGTAATPSDPEC